MWKLSNIRDYFLPPVYALLFPSSVPFWGFLLGPPWLGFLLWLPLGVFISLHELNYIGGCYYRIICVGVLAMLIPDAPCSFCTSVQFLRYFCWVIFTQILELLIGFCFGINSIKYLGKSATTAVFYYYWVYRFCNHSEKLIRTKKSLLIYYPWVNGFWILCQEGANASRLKRKGRLNLHLAVISDFFLQLINIFPSFCENIKPEEGDWGSSDCSTSFHLFLSLDYYLHFLNSFLRVWTATWSLNHADVSGRMQDSLRNFKAWCRKRPQLFKWLLFRSNKTIEKYNSEFLEYFISSQNFLKAMSKKRYSQCIFVTPE